MTTQAAVAVQPQISKAFTARVEDELVLLCSRAKVHAESSARIKAISDSPENVDWDYVYRLARRHAVLPLVYSQLNNLAAGKVPQNQFARLKENYNKNAARNVLLTAELCRILEAFAAAGIEAVPYKGPALAVYAYENLTLRRFVDLDILVRKADTLRAMEILAARGFACSLPWTEAQQKLLLRTQHNLALSREAGRLIGELDWEIAASLYASSVRAEDVWGHMQTIRLNNAVVMSLTPEDVLMSLCVHGEKRVWEQLAWICDVAQLVKIRTEINWALLMERAVSTGSDRMLFLGLYLAASLLGARLPGSVVSRLEADPVLVLLANQVSQRLFSPDAGSISNRQSFRFNWKIRSGWQSRLRYCRLLLRPTDADIETFALPGPLSFIYYLMRPFGLFRRDRERRLLVANDRER